MNIKFWRFSCILEQLMKKCPPLPSLFPSLPSSFQPTIKRFPHVTAKNPIEWQNVPSPLQVPHGCKAAYFPVIFPLTRSKGTSGLAGLWWKHDKEYTKTFVCLVWFREGPCRPESFISVHFPFIVSLTVEHSDINANRSPNSLYQSLQQIPKSLTYLQYFTRTTSRLSLTSLYFFDLYSFALGLSLTVTQISHYGSLQRLD